MTIDTIAERYGKLPSEVLAQGTTFDLFVMDAAASYKHYQQMKADGKYAANHTTDELQQLLERSRKNGKVR